jgi:Domain of unknown function (DUF4129)
VTTVLGGVDPDEARDQARAILSQRRFRPARVPRPFEGVLEWIGDRLRPVADLVDRLLGTIGGRFVLATGLVALVTVIATAIARRQSRGHVGSGVGTPEAAEGEESTDPARLERDADTAEQRGELDRALRLRFRAGLLRLDAAGIVRFRPSLTTGQVGRRLRQPAFDDLAVVFDEVAYGGRRASAGDVRAARAGWPRVLASVRTSAPGRAR